VKVMVKRLLRICVVLAPVLAMTLAQGNDQVICRIYLHSKKRLSRCRFFYPRPKEVDTSRIKNSGLSEPLVYPLKVLVFGLVFESY
jgi:hypothetical protein